MTKIRKNLIYNITYQILVLLLPLVTSSYLSRVVGATGVGRYSYTYSVALYFTYITMLGLNNYGNRTIAAVQHDLAKRSQTFWEIYIMQSSCFLASILFYAVYMLGFAHDRTLAIIQIFLVLSSLFDINWFFFGMELFDKTVIRNTVVKVISTILIFLLVKSKEDIWLYTLIMALSYLFSQLALWPFMKKYVAWPHIRNLNIKKHIKPNLVMFVPVIAVSIYVIADKIMLGWMATKAVVGYFENAQKIVTVPIAIINALGTVMLPRISSLVTSGKNSLVAKYRDAAVTLVIGFSTAAMLGIVGTAKQITYFVFGVAFLPSAKIMMVLSGSLIFIGVGNVIRTQLLIPYQRDKVYVFSTIIGAILNFSVNIVLIPKFGAIGASIGTVIAEFAVCGYQIYCVRNQIPVVYYLRETIFYLLVSIIMLICIIAVPNSLPLIPLLIIRIFIGVTIFGMLTLKHNRSTLHNLRAVD